MLTATRPYPIREAPRILLVNVIEDCDHNLLDDFVLQRRDPERPLPAIRFRNEHPSRRLRSISAAVNPAVQIGEPTFQTGFILLPRDAVHARCFSLRARKLSWSSPTVKWWFKAVDFISFRSLAALRTLINPWDTRASL
jgi:hypothetical protein